VLERRVLRVAERADRGVAGRVAGIAVGERDPPRGDERADAVVAGLAVDVREVVGGAERHERLAGRLGTAAEEAVEHLRPGLLVDRGGRGEHAVEVEQHRVDARPVERRPVAARLRHG